VEDLAVEAASHVASPSSWTVRVPDRRIAPADPGTWAAA
jgi:hypothetical protein